MTLRITVECTTYNVTINIICSQDVEVSQSDTDITILVRSVKVREKIISFFQVYTYSNKRESCIA